MTTVCSILTEWLVTRVVNTYGPQTHSGGGQGAAGEQQRGPVVRDCGNPAIEERLNNIETHLKLPEGQRLSWVSLKENEILPEKLSYLSGKSLLSVKKHQYSGCSTSALLLSGSSSIKFLPEAKEARGSDPRVGGTLTGVLSVHGESHGFELNT